MIFEFKKHQLGLLRFINYNVPKIINEEIQKFWDIHTCKLSYQFLNDFLNDKYLDANNIFYSLSYLKNHSKHLDATFISSIYNTDIFNPFSLIIKCVYNKHFIDIDTKNDVYNRLIKNLIVITFDPDVVESGKYILKLQDSINRIDNIITPKIVYDTLTHSSNIRISPTDCIKDFDETIIKLAEEKYIKLNLKHDIQNIN